MITGLLGSIQANKTNIKFDLHRVKFCNIRIPPELSRTALLYLGTISAAFPFKLLQFYFNFHKTYTLLQKVISKIKDRQHTSSVCKLSRLSRQEKPIKLSGIDNKATSVCKSQKADVLAHTQPFLPKKTN